jgi:hypothetical protein
MWLPVWSEMGNPRAVPASAFPLRSSLPPSRLVRPTAHIIHACVPGQAARAVLPAVRSGKEGRP